MLTCYIANELLITINPNSIRRGGGWHDRPNGAKFCEKCPCSHNNNTALIKHISLYDTALVITNR